MPDILPAPGGGGLSAPVSLADLATQAQATLVGRAAGAGTGVPSALTAAQVRAVLGAGTVAQVVIATQTGKVSTTTVLPSDDTIAQNTEGAELLTATITPKVATSTLVISISGFFVFSALGTVSHAIFEDSTADALWQGVGSTTPTGGYATHYTATISVPANSVSARTYKWRFGGNNPGTTTAHGAAAPGPDDCGGKMQHTMVITEVLA